MSNFVPVYFDKGAYNDALNTYTRRQQAHQEAQEKGWGTTCEMIYPPNKADYLVTSEGKPVNNNQRGWTRGL